MSRTRSLGERANLASGWPLAHDRPDILGLVSGMTARLMLIGIVFGLAGSLASGRVISGYVEGWNPKGPIAFVGVTMVLVSAAALACYIPARRPTRIQPMPALRHE